MNFQKILENNRVIAATEQQNLQQAMKSKASAIIVMHGKISELMELSKERNDTNKPVFLHTDLLKGLSNDKEAAIYLGKHIRPAGIVSTKSPFIRAAKKEGLATIQRLFLIDTGSLRTAIQNVRENQPDAIEVMPGIAPSIVHVLGEQLDQPIILGGLIWNKEQIDAAIHAGADAVSLSEPSLWNYEIL